MAEEMTLQELQEILSICLDEVCKLKEENIELKEKVNVISHSFSELIDYCERLSNDFENTKQNIATSLRIQDYGLDNIFYEINDPRRNKSSLYYPRFYDIEDSIDKIINERCSMARFGDGEFSIMAGHDRQKFQKYNDVLSKRLQDVINVREERFLIAIADNYGELTKYSRAGKSGIRAYMTDEVRKEHAQFIDINRMYHNAYISRPCVLFADCETKEPLKRFNNLKNIWKNRNVIIIEGAETRLGVGNDLLNESRTIRRIECPPENAFNKYKEILQAALEYGISDCLYLIALGPMAGVLAYDLFQNGYQALDIGHIDLEYEWYLHGNGKRCAIKGKYNNEVIGGEQVEIIEDDSYKEEIVTIIN